jgi:hypothetical protein
MADACLLGGDRGLSPEAGSGRISVGWWRGQGSGDVSRWRLPAGDLALCRSGRCGLAAAGVATTGSQIWSGSVLGLVSWSVRSAGSLKAGVRIVLLCGCAPSISSGRCRSATWTEGICARAVRVTRSRSRRGQSYGSMVPPSPSRLLSAALYGGLEG